MLRPSAAEGAGTWFVPGPDGPTGARTRDPYRDAGGQWRPVGDQQATVVVAYRYDTPHPRLAGARHPLSRTVRERGLGVRVAARLPSMGCASRGADRIPGPGGPDGSGTPDADRDGGGLSAAGGRCAGDRPSLTTLCRGEARLAQPRRGRGNGSLLVLSVQGREARVSLPRIGGGRVVLVDSMYPPFSIGRCASGSTRCHSLGSVCLCPGAGFEANTGLARCRWRRVVPTERDTALPDCPCPGKHWGGNRPALLDTDDDLW